MGVDVEDVKIVEREKNWENYEMRKRRRKVIEFYFIGLVGDERGSALKIGNVRE
jgi:hypothetical protein